MPTYVVLADVHGGEFQNPQELGAIWGEIRNDIEAAGGEPGESYVIAGEYDFLITYDVEDTETAISVAIAIERHGLDTQTMAGLPIERLGDLVGDV